MKYQDYYLNLDINGPVSRTPDNDISGVARGGAGGGAWPPGASLGGGAGPAYRGEF